LLPIASFFIVPLQLHNQNDFQRAPGAFQEAYCPTKKQATPTTNPDPPVKPTKNPDPFQNTIPDPVLGTNTNPDTNHFLSHTTETRRDDM
jgi:hypothetical protein